MTVVFQNQINILVSRQNIYGLSGKVNITPFIHFVNDGGKITFLIWRTFYDKIICLPCLIDLRYARSFPQKKNIFFYKGKWQKTREGKNQKKHRPNKSGKKLSTTKVNH